VPSSLDWHLRPAFDRMFDDIVAAASVRELDHLREQARHEFAADPRLPEMERVLDGMRRLLAARRLP